MNESIELLSPAGGMEQLKSALQFGANAVYAGGPMLQLRAGNTGFSLENLREAAIYCHERNAKLYVAANAFVYPTELPEIAEYAKRLSEIGIDAMIVSDLGAIACIKRACPEMQVHVSTQMNVTNYETARVCYEMGASRVVLARELNLEQIRVFREKAPKALEIEAFVHGAMCMAYSGRCLISNYLTGRGANRGGCAQSCRWKYALTEEKRPGQYFPIEEDENGTSILSSYDMNAMPVLRELLNAGVTSLKIEGRMKTAYYVATVVNAYRMYLNGAPYETCMAELNAVSHRPYAAGFYRDEAKTTPPAPEGYEKTREFLANIISCENGRMTCIVKNKITENSEIELLVPGQAGILFTAKNLRSPEGDFLSEAQIPNQLFTMDAPPFACAGGFLRGKT